MKTVLLLILSNTFMNLAWYGHLKFKEQPLWIVILASWGIALFEYIFQVPANRIGSNEWTVPQLKVLQECITLVVFSVVAFALFRSPIKWNMCVSYAFIIGAVYFAFKF
jgi:hypothetical protein